MKLNNYFNNRSLNLSGKALVNNAGDIYVWAQINSGRFTFIHLNFKENGEHNNRFTNETVTYSGVCAVEANLTKEQIIQFFPEDYDQMRILSLKEAVFLFADGV